MSNESNQVPNHRFRDAIYNGARLLLHEANSMQKNMGAGFSQANSGEAGLRAQGVRELKVTNEIKQLNLVPMADVLPEAWQTES